VGRPQDENSSVSRITAKSGSAGGADGPLLEKREKWRTPSSFVSAFNGKARAILSALMWPTRPSTLTDRVWTSGAEAQVFAESGRHG
jgi:hypothetical protein